MASTFGKVKDLISGQTANSDGDSSTSANSTTREEPLSGAQGQGTATDPYDGGNRQDQPDAPRTQEDTSSNREPQPQPQQEQEQKQNQDQDQPQESEPGDAKELKIHADPRVSPEALRGPETGKPRKEFEEDKRKAKSFE